MEKRNYFIIASVFAILLTISFASASACVAKDGYFRNCDSSYGKPTTYTGYYSKGFNLGYNNYYNVNKQVDKTYHKYNFRYELDYENDYDAGYYGYDKFTYYDNGYEHNYKYGAYTTQRTQVKVEYEESHRYGSKSYGSSPYY